MERGFPGEEVLISEYNRDNWSPIVNTRESEPDDKDRKRRFVVTTAQENCWRLHLKRIATTVWFQNVLQKWTDGLVGCVICGISKSNLRSEQKLHIGEVVSPLRERDPTATQPYWIWHERVRNPRIYHDFNIYLTRLSMDSARIPPICASQW